MTDKQTKESESTEASQTIVGNNIEEKPKSKSLVENLLSIDKWLRFAFMVLFAIILSVVSYLIGLLVLLQFIFVLVTGQDNSKVRSFCSSLSVFISQTLQFLTYNSEEKPFPFADWPNGDSGEKNSSSKES